MYSLPENWSTKYLKLVLVFRRSTIIYKIYNEVLYAFINCDRHLNFCLEMTWYTPQILYYLFLDIHTTLIQPIVFNLHMITSSDLYLTILDIYSTQTSCGQMQADQWGKYTSVCFPKNVVKKWKAISFVEKTTPSVTRNTMRYWMEYQTPHVYRYKMLIILPIS